MTYRVVFTGSIMNGLDKDLVSWSGMDPLSDDQHDLLWGTINEQDLLEECDAAEICFIEETDEHPGYSDEYYEVHCEDEATLKNQIRTAILARVKRS